MRRAHPNAIWCWSRRWTEHRQGRGTPLPRIGQAAVRSRRTKVWFNSM